MTETWQGSNGPLRWAIGKAMAVLIVGLIAAMMITRSDEHSATGKERVFVAEPLNTPLSQEGIDVGQRTLVLRADRQGHFWVNGEMGGVTIPFMIDTGATSVALDRETAARIGIRPNAREFTGRSNTANGTARVAPVVLRQLSIGQMTVRDVQADVLEGSMHGIGLLGMSFLRRLDGYEVRGDRLYLRWQLPASFSAMLIGVISGQRRANAGIGQASPITAVLRKYFRHRRAAAPTGAITRPLTPYFRRKTYRTGPPSSRV